MTETEQKEIFGKWLKAYKALLFKVVRVYAFDTDDQEDLFQEISIQMWKSIPQFKMESKESTWLYRIAINTALNWKRKRKKHFEGRKAVSEVEHVLRASAEEKDERLDWLYDEITKLNPIDKSLTLLLLDGYSYKEMSNILGLSESNVGVRINRIKKHLINRSEKLNTHGI